MSIILDHVSYIYDAGTGFAHTALDDVSLKIDDGAFIGLIGHTGSGKSTLIQMMNALLSPTTGNVYYDGADVSDKEYDRRALRAKVGLVFQYPEHQLFEADVFTDVCFGPNNLQLEKKDVELRAYEALKQVGIEDDCFYRSPFDLSGGQKRRVAIAGVLAMKPDVLILDEPAAGLDPQGKKEILDLVRSLHTERGITVILVSHSMEDVADYVDRIIVMNRGRIAMDGTPADVFSRADELEGMGLSAPDVTYIMHGLRDRGLDVRTDITRVRDAKEEILEALRRRGVRGAFH